MKGGAEGGSRGDGAARILGLHLSDCAQDGGGSDPPLPSFTAAGSLQDPWSNLGPPECPSVVHCGWSFDCLPPEPVAAWPIQPLCFVGFEAPSSWPYIYII